MPLRRGFGWECAAPGQLWEVVDDGKAGGVPVQIDQDPSSRPTPSLLANGSVVEQLALWKDARLQFRLISGTGPKQGWLNVATAAGTERVCRRESTAIATSVGTGVLNERPAHEGLQLLDSEHRQLWDVVRDDVLVSVLQNERSASAEGSLQKGARLAQLRRDGNRLHFHKLEGDGPSHGWLSILKGGRPQAILVDDEVDVVELQAKIQHLPFFLTTMEEPNPLQVSIPQGVIQGHIITAYNRPLAVFHDVPTATFTQRFGIPDGPHPWVGTRHGKWPTICPQEETTGRIVYAGEFMVDADSDSSERGHLCISIQAPLHAVVEGATGKEPLLPVEAHFHGGISWGFGHQTPSTAFAAAIDMVNVDLYYRTGPLASFAHPDLSAENGNCSGAWRNYDVVESLMWIKKNISKFGGDPDKVLGYAISGGNAQLMQCLASPLSKGLVKAAYLCSPPSDFFLRRSTKFGRGDSNPAAANWLARMSGEELGLYIQKEFFNCNSLAEVRALPVVDFLEPFYGDRDIAFMYHCVDGDMVRGPVTDVVENGLWPHPDLPIVVEMVKDEGNILIGYQGANNIKTHINCVLGDWTWDEFAIAMAKHFKRATPKVLKAYAQLEGFYNGEETRLEGEELQDLACKVTGDLMHVEGSLMLLQHLAKQGVPTYFIEWQWNAEGDNSKRVGHGLQVLFSHAITGTHPLWGDKSYEIASLARGTMRKLVETGSPGWPPLTADLTHMAFLTPQGNFEVNLPGQREALLARCKSVAPFTDKMRAVDSKTFGLAASASWRSDLLDRPHSMLPDFIDDDYDVGEHVV